MTAKILKISNYELRMTNYFTAEANFSLFTFHFSLYFVSLQAEHNN